MMLGLVLNVSIIFYGKDFIKRMLHACVSKNWRNVTDIGQGLERAQRVLHVHSQVQIWSS